MRFSTSALVVVLLQNSSLLSPNDAFSPPLARVVKLSSSLQKKHDALYARQHDDEDSVLNNDNGDDDTAKSRIVPSMLLGGAAFQLSTSKVSACCMLYAITHHKFIPSH